ncbi:MAG: IS66 family transposase [Clostridia bacterium]|nr:IS66 family transposase [Clostridia bacterium]
MDINELLKQLQEANNLINKLKSDNDALASENNSLNEQNTFLHKELENKNIIISKQDSKIQSQIDEINKLNIEMYKVNSELNSVVSQLNAYKEKYDIVRIKQFISQNEKIENIIINEPEHIKKTESLKRKSNLGKKYKKQNIDFEKYVEKTIYLAPNEDVCPSCGEKLVVASEKVRYVVNVEPAKISVVKYVKQSKKCPNCNNKDHIIYYPLCNDNLRGTILSPSLGAYVLYNKYELGIPFEHLSKHFSNHLGFNISKENLSNYSIKLANILSPIFDRLKNDLINSNSHVIHSDETTLVVSNKGNDSPNDRKKSYVYSYSSSFFDSHQIRIYDFHESRSIDPTQKLLENFVGVVICDAFSGYDKLTKSNPNIKLQRCWAHVRRRFIDIVKSLPVDKRKTSVAFKIVECISSMFKEEAKLKQNKKLTIDLILKTRQSFLPIKNQLYKYIFESNPAKNSALFDAIKYAKGCWDDLFTFIDNPFVEMTNNTAERAIKPFVIQRKVFQTAGSYAGARYSTKLFSIIQTCLINNIDVEKYLAYVIENIDKEKIDDLLPYSKSMEIFKLKKLSC